MFRVNASRPSTRRLSRQVSTAVFRISSRRFVTCHRCVLSESLDEDSQSEGSPAVEVAGDMEKAHEKLVDELGGIPYHPNQIDFAVNPF